MLDFDNSRFNLISYYGDIKMEKAKVKKILAIMVIALIAIFAIAMIQQLTSRKIYFLRDGVPLSYGRIDLLVEEVITLDSEGMLDCRKTIGNDKQIIFILRDSEGNRVINSALTCPRFGVLTVDYCNNNNKIISTRTFIKFGSIKIESRTEQLSIPTR